MNKTIVVAFAFAVPCFVAPFWLVANGVEYKPVLPRGVPEDTTQEELDELIGQWTEEIRPTSRAGSKLEVDEASVDLGLIEPHTPVSHIFTLRNSGYSTLNLGDPKTSDDTVIAAFSQRQIPSGGEAQLGVKFTPYLESGPYSTTVTLPSSDPAQPSIELRVRGQVQRRIDASPRAIVFPDLDPRDKPQPQTTLVFCKVFDEYEIIENVCDLEQCNWTIEPATSDELAEANAKSGYRIQATLPPELPSGRYGGQLHLRIKPAGEEPLNTQVRVSAKVLRRLCIYGDEIDRDGIIDLGQTFRGTEKRAVLRVNVRDPLTELPEPVVEVEPSFVNVQLTPHNDGAGTPGCYLLEIVIPDTAPICSHLRPDQIGKIRIRTAHPRIPEQTLHLRMAVTPGRSANL